MIRQVPQNIQDISCDADFAIRANGQWHYSGTPIGRDQLVKLFSTILHRDSEGVYWLQTSVEKCRIRVEDKPYIAVDYRIENEGTAKQKLVFITNIEAEIPLDNAHSLKLDEKGPYIEMDKGLSARIGRSVYYRLVELCLSQKSSFAEKIEILSAGEYFLLGAIEKDSRDA